MDVGDFFVVRTNGLAAAGIRVVTQSTVNHAGVYVGDGQIVEAQPGGARIAPASIYPDAVWSTGKLGVTTDQGVLIGDEARRLIGTPYSWVDCACVGEAHLFGWHVPGSVRDRLNRVDRLMCSQLVDTAYLHGGVHLFADGRIPGDVSPGDLYDLIR